MGAEVADVEAPVDRSLDLGPALAAHLVQVGVLGQVVDGPREAAVAVEQRGGLGDGTPAVQVMLGVEGQVHADVLAPVPGRRLAGPRRRDHQRGAGRHAVAEALVDPDVGGVATAEIVGRDDEQLGVRGQWPRRSARDVTGSKCSRRRRPGDASSEPLEQRAGAEAATTAHGDQTPGAIGPLQFVQGGRDQPGAGAPQQGGRGRWRRRWG